MKISILSFVFATLASFSSICAAQEAQRRVPGPLPGPLPIPPSLKCCECIAGASNVAPLDLNTGQTGPVTWIVNSGPVYVVTSPHSSWVTSPPAQWVQSVNSPNPGVVGAGPFTYEAPFNVQECAIPYSMVRLHGTYAADNGATIWLDSTPGTPCPGQWCFKAPAKTFTFPSVAPGAHKLRVVVANQNGSVSGLLVNAKLEARCPVCPPPFELPMQGGNELTPCPVLGIVYTRAQAPLVPYLQIMLPNLDQQCATKGPGFKMLTIKFKTCCADPRGPGFGPNATADLTCG